jgi:hypothetical protein
MTGSAAACARGRARPRWARIERFALAPRLTALGEAHAGCMGEPEDADPPKIWRVIRACVVVESVIY